MIQDGMAMEGQWFLRNLKKKEKRKKKEKKKVCPSRN
jgi:hypothetical protein